VDMVEVMAMAKELRSLTLILKHSTITIDAPLKAMDTLLVDITRGLQNLVLRLMQVMLSRMSTRGLQNLRHSIIAMVIISKAMGVMDHLMAETVVITKDLLMQTLRLIPSITPSLPSITMAIITRALGSTTGCLIAATMDTTRDLLNLKLMQQSTTRGLPRPILRPSITDIIPRAMGEVMACPIAETMVMAKGLLMLKLMQKQMQMLMQGMVIMVIIPRAMEEATGCPIAAIMVIARGLQKLKQRLRQKLKHSTITMDNTPRKVLVSRKVTAPLMAATTKGLLKRNLSITTDMGTINQRAMALDTRGEVSRPEKSSARNTTTTNEAQKIPAPIWSAER